MKFLEFLLAIFLIKISKYSVNQQSIGKIEPLTTYLESRACQYSFNVSCGNQSISFDNLNSLASGNSSIKNSWPWVVGIWVTPFNNSPITYNCSGFILSNRYVLTNAKCINPFNLNHLQVVVGVSFPLPNSTNTFGVIKKLVHPKFNVSSIDSSSFNLALLVLSNTVAFSDNVFPVCLPQSASNFPDILNQTVFSTSFLAENSSNNTIRVLKQFKSKITNFYPDCTTSITFNTSTNYCASESETVPEWQNCSRSLGDGIMYFENNSWYIYGLLGELPSSNCSSTPLIYTQIPSNLWWFCESQFVSCENF